MGSMDDGGKVSHLLVEGLEPTSPPTCTGSLMDAARHASADGMPGSDWSGKILRGIMVFDGHWEFTLQ